MRVLIFSFLFVLTVASQCMAAGKTVTYYLDGAKIDYEEVYCNGYAEIRLSRDAVPNSLRIRPQSGANIDRIDLSKVPKRPKAAKEIKSLTERKNLLQDRLKALETRQEIFKAAAKSQSGRAPRKTKNNPDPVTNMRKGTEFAISQLESVYTMRRKTEQELASLDARLSSLQGANGGEESVCRVWFSTKRGHAHIAYLVTDLSWQPVYDFRLNGDGRAQMIMRAAYPSPGKNTSAYVIPAKMSDVDSNPVWTRPVSKPYGKIGEFSFVVENETLSPGPVSALTFTFNNNTDKLLPGGHTTCYRRGEYLGSLPFKGVGPRESVTLSFGQTAGK